MAFRTCHSPQLELKNIDASVKTIARMGMVEQKWTKRGGRVFSHRRGFDILGDVAQVPHHPER